MGLKINGAKKPVSQTLDDLPERAPVEIKHPGTSADQQVKKSTFENTEDSTPVPKKGARPIPDTFNTEEEPATGEWNPMDTAPTDRQIMVAGNIPATPSKWSYWEVQWYQPEGQRAGWYVAGTQWHCLYETFPQAWRESVGHP